MKDKVVRGKVTIPMYFGFETDTDDISEIKNKLFDMAQSCLEGGGVAFEIEELVVNGENVLEDKNV